MVLSSIPFPRRPSGIIEYFTFGHPIALASTFNYELARCGVRDMTRKLPDLMTCYIWIVCCEQMAPVAFELGHF